MRLKEFCIFIIIFTICYVIFCIIFDRFKEKREQRKYKEHINSLIQVEQYMTFAKFYGINGTLTKESILQINSAFQESVNRSLSAMANFYHITPIEMIVVLMYLEYYNLIPKYSIQMESDTITRASHVDQTLYQRYAFFLQQKKDVATITSSMGKNCLVELMYLNDHFLLPGVRLMDSNLYYVGDFL